MQSGKLRHTAVFEQKSSTIGDDGEELYSWSEYVSRLANIIPASGSERAIDDRQQAIATHKFTIRKTEGITTAMRISALDKYFQIGSILPDRTDERYMIIMATETI